MDAANNRNEWANVDGPLVRRTTLTCLQAVLSAGNLRRFAREGGHCSFPRLRGKVRMGALVFHALFFIASNTACGLIGM